MTVRKVVEKIAQLNQGLSWMNTSGKAGSSSAQALQNPSTGSEPQDVTAFERWRKKAWRAAGFGLSEDEQLDSMTRSCEKQRDYLMNYSAYNDLMLRTKDFNVSMY